MAQLNAGPDDDNPRVLDPAEPLKETKTWRLRDSGEYISGDPEIAEAWKKDGIEPTQIGGAWVYTRLDAKHDRSSIAPLVQAWARELAANR